MTLRHFIVWSSAAMALSAESIATQFYVRPGGNDGNSGQSWGQAYQTLSRALIAAQAAGPDVIWVAAGNYKPQPVPGNDPSRTDTFTIPPDTLVFGGFVGTELPGELALRNPETNETVLDGNIFNLNDPTDNCYHVVTIKGTQDTITKLSGFTIRNGYANGPATDDADKGGGVFVRFITGGLNADPMLNRLRIINNYAQAGGGGLLAKGKLVTQAANLWFEDNNTAGYGGGVLTEEGQIEIQNGVFLSNGATLGGGGLAVRYAVQNPPTFGGSAILRNCTFAANSSSGAGVALYSEVGDGESRSLYVFNSIIWEPENDPIELNVFTVSVDYSDISSDPDDDWFNAGFNNLSADPLFVNLAAGNLELQADSPAIDTGTLDQFPVDQTDVDDNGNVLELLPWDIDKAKRIVPDCAVDMGAYEFQQCIGDTNGDLIVDILDLANLLSCFGADPCECQFCESADWDCNPVVTIQDLAYLLAHFGQSCLTLGLAAR